MNRAAKQIREALKAHNVDNLQVDFIRRGEARTGICFIQNDEVHIKCGNEMIHARTGRARTIRSSDVLIGPDDAEQFDYIARWIRDINAGLMRTIRVMVLAFARIQCECGSPVTKVVGMQYVNHMYYCDACYALKFARCSACGDEILKEDAVEREGNVYCPACHSRGFFICAICGKEYHSGDVRSDPESRKICSTCYNEQYVGCAECGRTIPRDVALTLCGSLYCESCHENLKNNPHNYSFKPSPIFQMSAKQKAKHVKIDRYFGFELEIGDADDDAKGVAATNDAIGEWAYCKDDGSIPDYGFEIVSHPCTMEFLVEKRDVMKELFDDLAGMGYKSHDADNCGLHVHVSKKALGHMGWIKLDFLVNNHRSLFKKLARRESTYGKCEGKKMTQCAKNLNGDRYVSVNFLNDHTAEFRLWRGTLNISTFMATLQMCNLLLDFVHRQTLVEIMDYDLMENRLAKAILDGPEELKAYGLRLGMHKHVFEEALKPAARPVTPRSVYVPHPVNPILSNGPSAIIPINDFSF